VKSGDLVIPGHEAIYCFADREPAGYTTILWKEILIYVSDLAQDDCDYEYVSRWTKSPKNIARVIRGSGKIVYIDSRDVVIL
jgi:hypothetical protein